MRTFNDRSNPCFTGFNRVKMFDGSIKYVKNVKAGDVVWTPNGDATVKLVVKTICKDGLAHLSKIGTLTVTPWHPIYFSDEWMFPNDIFPARLTQCDSVYSFVLDKHHIMNISDYNVICLGHDYEEGILKHPFWGTQEIIRCLETKEGYSDGLVVLQSGCLMNDPTSGLVNSLN